MRYFVHFVGKGGVETRHEIYGPALSVIALLHETFFGKFDLESDRPLLLNKEGKRFKYEALYRRVLRIGEKAKKKGIVRKNLAFSPHCLRRSYVTLRFKNGMDVRSVQKLSRHKSVQTLFQYYIDSSEPPSPILDKIFSSPEN
jgi:integrase